MEDLSLVQKALLTTVFLLIALFLAKVITKKEKNTDDLGDDAESIYHKRDIWGRTEGIKEEAKLDDYETSGFKYKIPWWMALFALVLAWLLFWAI